MTTFKHPKGKSWRYDFVWKGRRYTGTTDQLTKADADMVESDLKKYLRQQAYGIAPTHQCQTPTFSDWAGHYYAHQAKRLTRPDILKRTLRLVLAFFGANPAEKPVAGGVYRNLRLGDLLNDPELIDDFERWMEKRGISGPTKNTYRSALSGMYRLAMRPSWRKKTQIHANPMLGTERDPTRSRKVTLTVEQLRAWIAASVPHVRIALAIGALAPKLRMMSILRLRWDQHIDPDLAFLTVHDHKTIRSSHAPQVVPIDPQLVAILTPLKAAAKKAKQKYVIAFRGQPVQSIRTALKRAARDAGIDYGRSAATFHSLRHTMATLLADLGVSEAVRQGVMGWADSSTAQGYTHLRPHHERAPLAALSAVVPIVDAVQGPVQGPAKRGTRKAEQKHILAKHRTTRRAQAKRRAGNELSAGHRPNS